MAKVSRLGDGKEKHPSGDQLKAFGISRKDVERRLRARIALHLKNCKKCRNVCEEAGTKDYHDRFHSFEYMRAFVFAPQSLSFEIRIQLVSLRRNCKSCRQIYKSLLEEIPGYRELVALQKEQEGEEFGSFELQEAAD